MIHQVASREFAGCEPNSPGQMQPLHPAPTTPPVVLGIGAPITPPVVNGQMLRAGGPRNVGEIVTQTVHLNKSSQRVCAQRSSR